VGDTSLVGEYTFAAETLLVGDNSLVWEKIFGGKIALDDDDVELGYTTSVWSGVLEAEVDTYALSVKPIALLSIPENVLLLLSALSGIPPVVDARFIGRKWHVFCGWTVELTVLLLSTLPAPNRENMFSDT
jgi:hypothetical protein